jgi:hypothetical protein
MFETVAVKPVEAYFGTKPHKSALILQCTIHGIIYLTIINLVPSEIDRLWLRLSPHTIIL